MKTSWNPGRILAGIYAWLLAVFFGSVLLDVVYSRLLKSAEGFPAGSPVFGEVADFLLILGAVTFLFALAAFVFSFGSAPARNLFLASFLLLGFEFVAPVILSPLLQGQMASSISALGPWLRLVPSGLASVLAFAGLQALYRTAKGGA
jgi:hypothetical protein